MLSSFVFCGVIKKHQKRIMLEENPEIDINVDEYIHIFGA